MTRKWRQPWVSVSAKALSLILWLRWSPLACQQARRRLARSLSGFRWMEP